MNKSPLILFLILLIVLVISVLLCKIWNAYCVEGMIGFGSEVNPMGGVKAAFYNATTTNGTPSDITKLHDSIFFDEKTTRLIHLLGADSNAAENVRNGVSSMTVYERNSTSKTFPVQYTYDVNGESQFVVGGEYTYTMSPVAPAYTSVVYTINDASVNPALTNYSVFYIPWGLSTFVHMVDLSANAHIGTYAQIHNQPSSTNDVKFVSSNSQPGINGMSVSESPPTNTMVDLTDSYWTGRKCLKIQEYTYLDTLTGNLIVYPALDGSLSAPTVYNRYNNIAQVAPSLFSDSNKYHTDASANKATFEPVSDLRVQILPAPNNVHLLYVSVNRDTLVAVINKTASGYGLLNTVRLSSDGTYNNTGSGGMEKAKDAPAAAAAEPAKEAVDAEPTKDAAAEPAKDPAAPVHANAGDYLKWLDNYYADITRGSATASSDYILKTQIVPPVCPACQTLGGCSGSCEKPAAPAQAPVGPQAGVAAPAQAGPQAPAQAPAPAPAQAPVGVVGTTGNAVRDVVSETTGLARDAVSGTAGLARDAASGTVGFAKDAVSGTAGFAKDAVSGTAGFAKDAVSGTAGFAKDLVTGTVDLAKGLVSGTAGLARGASGQYNQPAQGLPTTTRSMLPDTNRGMLPATSVVSDPYSYYGQLPTKAPASFLPLTADFSSFGR